MNINKKGIYTVIAVFILIVAAVCIVSKEQARKLDDGKIIVLLSGAADDQNWNMTNANGVRACNQERGINIQYVENIKEANFESVMTDYAEDGYQLIIAAGSQFNMAVEAVAPKYKKTIFCVINGRRNNLKNVIAIQPKEYEASYLAALIAMDQTETGNFGVIGGYPNDAMKKLLDIYETTAVQGAKDRGLTDANSKRAYTNSWVDMELGKMITDQMIEGGVDTLFVYANEIGVSCIQEAQKYGIKMIGFSSNQTQIAPDTVVASVIFDFRRLYSWIIESYEKGTLTDNAVYCLGVKEHLFYPVYTRSISKDTKAKVQHEIEEMELGKINVIEE